jgi:tRNA(Ile)-lysidine synthase
MTKAARVKPKQLKRGGRKPRREASATAMPIAARRHPLIAEIQRELGHCCVFNDEAREAPAPIVIGVSGGADSIALLLGCIVLRDRSASKSKSGEVLPIVGHVHHHLRDSADADAQHVEELCGRFGVEFHAEHVYPGNLKGNVSANARMLRYEALAKIAKKAGARHVAVAHHGEDQLETMLIALCRGTGLDGLTGMAWSRPLWSGVSLIRPLLAASKADCEDLCRKAGIQWREDPSNVDPRRARARLRQEVMPALQQLWPDIARRITGCAEVLCAAKLALEQHLDVAFGEASTRSWKRDSLRWLAGPIIAAGLRRAALDAVPLSADELNQRHLSLAADAIGSTDRRPRTFDWPRGLKLEVTSKLVTLHER